MVKKRILGTGALAIMMTVAGQFMPLGGAPWSDLGMQPAEAFSLGDLGGVILGGPISVDDMQNRHQDMMHNLMLATLCEGHSAVNSAQAVGMHPEQYQALQAAVAQAQDNHTNLDIGAMRGLVDAEAKITPESWQQAYAAAPTKEASDEAKGYASRAASLRRAAGLYNLMAARDAIAIVREASMGLMHSDNLGDKVQAVQELMSTAQDVQSILKIEKKMSKDRAGFAKQYDKAMNIKAVDDKEAKATAEKIILQ